MIINDKSFVTCFQDGFVCDWVGVLYAYAVVLSRPVSLVVELCCCQCLITTRAACQ